MPKHRHGKQCSEKTFQRSQFQQLENYENPKKIPELHFSSFENSIVVLSWTKFPKAQNGSYSTVLYIAKGMSPENTNNFVVWNLRINHYLPQKLKIPISFLHELVQKVAFEEKD